MRHVSSLFGQGPLLAAAVAGIALFGAVACGGGSSTVPDGATGSGSSGPGGAGSGGGSSETGGAGSETGGGSSTGGGSQAGECTADTPCAAGVCTGSDCGEAWACVVSEAGCTKDLVDYCGCDGVTFQDSGNCPTRPYSYKGACSSNPDGIDCNDEHITCLPIVAPDPCPDGKVYSVVNNCYGECVELAECSCNVASDCPGDNACYNFSKKCGPWLK
jgi:hypothetical protein